MSLGNTAETHPKMEGSGRVASHFENWQLCDCHCYSFSGETNRGTEQEAGRAEQSFHSSQREAFNEENH